MGDKSRAALQCVHTAAHAYSWSVCAYFPSTNNALMQRWIIDTFIISFYSSFTHMAAFMAWPKKPFGVSQTDRLCGHCVSNRTEESIYICWPWYNMAERHICRFFMNGASVANRLAPEMTANNTLLHISCILWWRLGVLAAFSYEPSAFTAMFMLQHYYQREFKIRCIFQWLLRHFSISIFILNCLWKWNNYMKLTSILRNPDQNSKLTECILWMIRRSEQWRNTSNYFTIDSMSLLIVKCYIPTFLSTGPLL